MANSSTATGGAADPEQGKVEIFRWETFFDELGIFLEASGK